MSNPISADLPKDDIRTSSLNNDQREIIITTVLAAMESTRPLIRARRFFILAIFDNEYVPRVAISIPKLDETRSWFTLLEAPLSCGRLLGFLSDIYFY